MPSLTVGSTFTHGTVQYKLEEVVGQGGFGQVFRATRVEQDAPHPLFQSGPTTVAVKKPTTDDPEFLRRFEREARILGNLSHRNIVKIVSFLKFPDGDPVIVQEYVKGGRTFADYVREKWAPKDLPAILSVLVQAMYAVQAFHGDGTSAGTIHRDLSPRNILVNEDDIVKVIDFGLATHDPKSTVLTLKGVGFGTPGIAPPEQYEQRAAATVDRSADIFSVGRTLAACLQNRNPIYVDISKLPEPWRSTCEKLAEHEPEDRYESVDAALSDTFLRFAAAGIDLGHFHLHVDEMRGKPLVAGWPEICRLHYETAIDVSMAELRWASRLEPEVFTSPGFEADAFLERLEDSIAICSFETGAVSFDDCDPLGDLYRRLYSGVTSENKKGCFRRLVRTAVNWHRYHVMGLVRAVYRNEPDAALKDELIKILDEEDPDQIIEGRGIIPGRTP